MRVCWNRQTGTFEGRVSSTYGFKSRHSHQTKKDFHLEVLFVLLCESVLCVDETYSYATHPNKRGMHLLIDADTSLTPIDYTNKFYIFLIIKYIIIYNVIQSTQR